MIDCNIVNDEIIQIMQNIWKYFLATVNAASVSFVINNRDAISQQMNEFCDPMTAARETPTVTMTISISELHDQSSQMSISTHDRNRITWAVRLSTAPGSKRAFPEKSLAHSAKGIRRGPKGEIETTRTISRRRHRGLARDLARWERRGRSR